MSFDLKFQNRKISLAQEDTTPTFAAINLLWPKIICSNSSDTYDVSKFVTISPPVDDHTGQFVEKATNFSLSTNPLTHKTWTSTDTRVCNYLSVSWKDQTKASTSNITTTVSQFTFYIPNQNSNGVSWFGDDTCFKVLLPVYHISSIQAIPMRTNLANSAPGLCCEWNSADSSTDKDSYLGWSQAFIMIDTWPSGTSCSGISVTVTGYTLSSEESS